MAEERQQEENQQTDGAGAGGNGSGEGGQGLLSSLLSKEVLIPALVTAGGVIAYTARNSVKDKAEDTAGDVGRSGVEGAKEGISDAGGSGIGGLASGLASRALGGGGGGGGGSSKKTRRLPIQRWTDVAVPVETAYERWTQFEDFPNFMHRVLNVQQEDEDKVSWDEKIWFSKRHWEAEITERRKNERLAWRTTSGMAHAGVVSFHRLDKNLTRVMVTMDFVPQGTIEKMASGLRFVKRAVQADLARFKAYVEMGEAEDLEYRSRPEQKGEEEGEGDDGGGRARGEGSEDGDREAERRERESRRDERREKVSA